MQALITSSDVLFVLLGAMMVLAMHAGFAFLEVGTVRKKNQVNALVKIMVDFSVSTIAYFFIGYSIASVSYTHLVTGYFATSNIIVRVAVSARSSVSGSSCFMLIVFVTTNIRRAVHHHA